MDWRILPPLSALRAFAAFGETRNVVDAGKALGVSHAAISQQLRTLEQHLDVPLLDSHDRHRATATIGRARNFRLEDGAVVADLTFSTAQDVSPIVDRVRDGTLTSFSVGYSVAAWRDGVTEGTRTRTATQWTIQEVSLVAIPADPNAKKRSESDMALDETNDRAELVENLRTACGLSEAGEDRNPVSSSS